jgi:putative ABC transport system permease protein
VPNVVTPGYFETMGIPLTAGRDFNASDSDGAERVVIIGASLAERLFPGQNPLGQRIAHYGWFGPLPVVVIGVAGDVRRSGLSAAFGGEAYLPMAQYRHPGSDLVIRFEPDRATASAVDIQRWLEVADPELVVDIVRPFSVGLDRSVQRERGKGKGERRLAITLAAFAATAALLAVLGVFGLVSHVTTQRWREFGIRLALGSPRLRIIGLVLGAGLGWIALGVSLGGLAMLAYGRWVAREIGAGGAVSLQAFCASAALLTSCALAACMVQCSAPSERRPHSRYATTDAVAA